MWEIDEESLESIAIGAGILGTGGGGNPYLGKLRARQVLRRGHECCVISPEDLAEDAHVICVGGMGAPTVGVEKFRSCESYTALRAVEDFCGIKASALVSGEIGGSNSIEPMIAASVAGVPVVDADGMGRAFPELQMTTFFIVPLARARRPSACLPRAGDSSASATLLGRFHRLLFQLAAE